MAIQLLIFAGVERLVYLIISLLMVILIIVGWVLISKGQYLNGAILIGVGLTVTILSTWIRWNRPVTLINKLLKLERSGFGALKNILSAHVK